MPSLERTTFGAGWMPDADAVNGPPDALLRADNLQQDELGATCVRLGSAKIYQVGDANIHSLFSAVSTAGQRYRFMGGGSAVYQDGVPIIGDIAGGGDIAFATYQGQVFFARSTSKKKTDATTVRNWGIAAPGTMPQVAALSADQRVFASCDSTESPALVWTHDDGTGAGYRAGFNGASNGAAVLNPAGDGTGILTKTFATPVDFTTYVGGQVGGDDDTIEFYLFLVAPLEFLSLTLAIDVNDGSFLQDYYTKQWSDPSGNPPAGPIDPRNQDGIFEGNFDVTGFDRQRAIAASGTGTRVATSPRLFPSGWTRLTVRRGSMARVGTTAGQGWNTVKAIQFTLSTGGSGAAAQAAFDALRIYGGTLRPISGKAQWKYILVYDSGTYQTKSAPSPASAALAVSSNGVNVTIPADATRDPQVNQAWVYRMDDALDDFYRIATATVSGTGAIVVADTMADTDALALDLTLDQDTAPPPDNIIGIAGPYFDRLFVLTTTDLYPSRQLSPDNYASTQVIHIAGAEERALWVTKAFGGLYVGTTRDVYIIQGDGAELPDGSLNFVKRPLNIDHPPISSGFAQEGNQLVYLADDGWRAFNSTSSSSLTGGTSWLYRGVTRHGVLPVNLKTGRFRAVMAKGQLLAITPEGASAASSSVLYRLTFRRGAWSRHVYPAFFRSLFREPDGTIIAGDSAGFLWQLDTGTLDDGAKIPVTAWTKVDANGELFNRKDPWNFRCAADTGGDTATVAFHRDASDVASLTLPVAGSGEQTVSGDLTSLGNFAQLQLRLTGSMSTFRWRGFQVAYESLPPILRGQTPPQRFGYSGVKTLSGLQLRLCTLGQTVNVTAILDGVVQPSLAVQTGPDDPQDVTYAFASSVEAVEIVLAVDGDVEVYGWAPIVTARRPLGVLSWRSGPIDFGSRELVWLRRLQLKVRAGAALTITPYFDGVAFPAATVPVTAGVDTIVDVPIGRHYVGRQPDLVVTSSAPFFPYWIKTIARDSGQVTGKPVRTFPVTLETGGA